MFRKLAAPFLILALATGAVAQTGAQKALIDTAKTTGVVGEKADGFLGLVKGDAPGDVIAAMQAINAGRQAVYRETAAKTGVTPEAAGQATALKLYARMPPGEYWQALGGNWTRK